MIQLAPLLIVVLLAAAAAARTSAARRGAPALGVLSGLGVLATAAWSPRGEVWTLSWAPELGLEFAWTVDALTAPLLGLVGIVLVGVVVWTAAWERSGASARLLSALVTFTAAMVGLLTAANLLTLFLFWELTTLSSYALIGFDGSSERARDAARSSLLVTGLGGLALLAAAVLIDGTSASNLSTLVASADATDPRVVAGVWLLLVAAATKSAQVPFHGWLTGATTAPTAASALLHAATLVVAGAYLILRIAPLGARVPGWTVAAVATGVVTYAWGHWGSRHADDAKQLLAGTTAAQVGLAFALAALATPKSTVAALALLLVHGLYKAGLFLVVGTVAKRTGSQRVADVAAGTAGLPTLRLALWLGAAAMAGLPPTAGWVAKEAGVAALASDRLEWLTVTLTVAGTALAVAVAARLVAGRGAPTIGRHVPAMGTAVPLLAGGATLLLGPGSALLERVAEAGAAAGRTAAFTADAAAVHLVVWPGFVEALGISVLALALGLAAAGRDRRTNPSPRDLAAPVLLARGIDRFGARAGQLATSIAAQGRRTIVGLVVAAAVASLWPYAVAASRWPDDLVLVRGAPQLLAATVVVAGVIGLLRARERFIGAIMLGMVGFAMGGLFVVVGAPDLLLTQVAVEVVIVLVFAGVLRRLPEREATPRDSLTEPATVLRLVVAVAAGLLTADLALSLADSDSARPVAAAITTNAVPEGGGTNAVNVVLTDFRAIDTVGELMVIFLSAAGGVGLARARRRQTSPRRVAHGRPSRSTTTTVRRGWFRPPSKRRVEAPPPRTGARR